MTNKLVCINIERKYHQVKKRLLNLSEADVNIDCVYNTPIRGSIGGKVRVDWFRDGHVRIRANGYDERIVERNMFQSDNLYINYIIEMYLYRVYENYTEEVKYVLNEIYGE